MKYLEEMTNENQMNIKINKVRRQVLMWTAPVVASVTLPVHAQTSPSSCTAPPLVSVPAAPKCAGNPPIGTALLEILAPNTDSMELIDIQVTSADPASTLTLPSLPASLNDSIPLEITWDGPASDALTCLPLTEISMTLEYACNGDGISVFESYDVTALLIESVP